MNNNIGFIIIKINEINNYNFRIYLKMIFDCLRMEIKLKFYFFKKNKYIFHSI